VAVSALIIGIVFEMFYAGMSPDFFVKWIGFSIMTALLFGIFIENSRALLRKRSFWLLFTSFLIVHCAAWAIILTHTKTWKFIWFYPMILEILILQYGRSQLKRRLHKRNYTSAIIDSD
jgi:hypothetical protein